MTRRRLAAAANAGVLVSLRRGVYAYADACAEARAAARHGGTLACVSAARHIGLWVVAEAPEPGDAVAAEPVVHVWLKGDRHSYTDEDCTCVEHWDHGTTADPFGLPSVPRILRQILGCRGIESFFVALESALRQRRLSGAHIRWLRQHTNAAARDAIDFARTDAGSGLESLLRWRLRPHGLTVRSQVQVDGVGRVDFLIGERLLVEVDGRLNHDGESLRHKDLVRDAGGAMWGYTTLRFDYAMVVHDWDLVERAILAHVELDGRAQLRGS